MTTEAHFTLVNTAFNPGSYSKPTFADIDNDGDFDAFCGTYEGSIVLYQNQGTATNPNFVYLATDPYGLTDVGSKTNIAFLDMDKDGDLDATISGSSYYANTGTPSVPQFTKSTINFGLADGAIAFDSAGNAYVGTSSGYTYVDKIQWASHSTSTGSGTWAGQAHSNSTSSSNPYWDGADWVTTALTNPYGLKDVGDDAVPALADIDGDGDQDAFVGSEFDGIQFFLNYGSNASPAYAAPVANPFGLTYVDSNSAPTFVDIDNDGDLDAFVGSYNGNVYFFRNDPNTAPTATNLTQTIAYGNSL